MKWDQRRERVVGGDWTEAGEASEKGDARALVLE